MPSLTWALYSGLGKPGFYGSDEQRALIEAFIIEYITVYDDDDVNNRKNLINAYDENFFDHELSFVINRHSFEVSVFVEVVNVALCEVSFVSDWVIKYSTYNTYRKSSHNVMCVEKWERFREKVVHKGAMDIIVMLRKLPATKHLMDTFVVDVSMTTAKHMCFAVHGFFRDSMTKVQDDDEVKFFCRNFVVVNKGEGKIAVLSDILFVSGVFTERIQRYKSMITSLIKAVPDTGTSMNMDGAGGSMSVGDGAENRWLAEPSPAPQSSVPQPTPAQCALAGDLQMQEQMVAAFSQESKMKPEWSRKCLLDQDWDYEVLGAYPMFVSGLSLSSLVAYSLNLKILRSVCFEIEGF
ncbi:unnamed protein product [Gongylonema pulchrum]|uniref:NTF2 domain-containing protein n=1 Tax=Gongylonema pulchrum TaxID=637853 RepID=A0A183EF27_9BILA|nr:unnamed protein product [Gongylonema pulchrum]